MWQQPRTRLRGHRFHLNRKAVPDGSHQTPSATLVCTSFAAAAKTSCPELVTTPDQLLMESGTPVKLQLTQTITFAHAHKGDRLAFVVEKDVDVGGYTVIRAGAPAEGAVVAVKGKRPFGMGGDIILKLDSVELATGEKAGLVGRREYKGRAHTIRMAVGMAVTAAFHAPAAPVLLLTRGRDSTVLKGTEVTAYTRDESWMEAAKLPLARENVSELSELMKLLPPRVMNGEGREGDMLNMMFVTQEEELQETFASAGWLKVGEVQTTNYLASAMPAKTLHEIADEQTVCIWEIAGLFVRASGSEVHCGSAAPSEDLENRARGGWQPIVVGCGHARRCD